MDLKIAIMILAIPLTTLVMAIVWINGREKNRWAIYAPAMVFIVMLLMIFIKSLVVPQSIIDILMLQMVALHAFVAVVAALYMECRNRFIKDE